jgi:nickel-dependent lactate racemase
MKLMLDFKPGIRTPLEIARENLLFYAAPLKTGAIPDQQKIVEDSLDHPIGTDRLENLLKPDMQVVILVDDITRPTPTAKLLPPILARIEKAGISDAHLKIIMALGTHRPMTDEELEVKLGPAVMKRYTILNRDYRDSSKFIRLESTRSGVPIEVDREVYEADFVIGLGNIIPHISAGWSGGAKIILPGVCSAATTDMMHYKAATLQPVLEILGTSDNIPRNEMVEIAGKVGLSFIVNTVLDDQQNMLGVFSGHYVKAHAEGTKLAEKVMVVPIPRKADIVIVSANPCHVDYWQGIKPYAYSHRAVRDGGVLIFLLDGSEHLCGDAPSHEATLSKYMLWKFDDLVREVENGAAADIVGMNVPMYHSVLRQRVTNLIVTNHMTQEEVDILGFERMPSVQAALDRAYAILGRDSSVGIIPYGGETLTRVNLADFERFVPRIEDMGLLASP